VICLNSGLRWGCFPGRLRRTANPIRPHDTRHPSPPAGRGLFTPFPSGRLQGIQPRLIRYYDSGDSEAGHESSQLPLTIVWYATKISGYSLSGVLFSYRLPQLKHPVSAIRFIRDSKAFLPITPECFRSGYYGSTTRMPLTLTSPPPTLSSRLR
jgi:hypothetical protein